MQRALGVDIMMTLDECAPYPASAQRVLRSVELTTRWAERSLKVERGQGQALFAIVQGGVYPNLRELSARQLTAMPFEGFAVGGLSVGEPKAQMLDIAALVCELLPKDHPRYLMGVGTPQDLLAGIALGYDLFDCVLPTRNARNGNAFTACGVISIKQARYTRDSKPLDASCSCRPCQTFSRAYLRHLYLSGDILAARALTEHNLFFYGRLMSQARAAIVSGAYQTFSAGLLERMSENAVDRE